VVLTAVLIRSIYARRLAMANGSDGRAAKGARRRACSLGDCQRITAGYSAADPMTTETGNGAPAAPGEQVQPAEGAAPPSSSKPASAEESAPAAEQKVDSQTEAARLRDQLLRTAADFDNYRKRSRREQEEAQKRGRESVIKDMLPVFDNLERAATSAEAAPDVKSVSDGLRIVLKQFTDTLEKIGLRRIATVGQPFDPAVHEAIQHIASKDHPAGVVVAEVQPGYAMGDHLVRAALVVVSKGA
jgi:molecular chaperone GrpE